MDATAHLADTTRGVNDTRNSNDSARCCDERMSGKPVQTKVVSAGQHRITAKAVNTSFWVFF